MMLPPGTRAKFLIVPLAGLLRCDALVANFNVSIWFFIYYLFIIVYFFVSVSI